MYYVVQSNWTIALIPFSRFVSTVPRTSFQWTPWGLYTANRPSSLLKRRAAGVTIVLDVFTTLTIICLPTKWSQTRASNRLKHANNQISHNVFSFYSVKHYCCCVVCLRLPSTGRRCTSDGNRMNERIFSNESSKWTNEPKLNWLVIHSSDSLAASQ